MKTEASGTQAGSAVKQKLVILIGFMPNPRMFRRARLESELYDVHIICWNRGANMIPHKEQNTCTIHEIAIEASENPLKRLVPYARFKRQATALLKELRPAVIHAQMVDMLKIGVEYQKRCDRGVRLIYEIADLHRLLVDRQTNPVNKLAQAYLKKEDRKCSKAVDLLILTSEQYYELYFKDFFAKEKTLYFPNVPDLSAFGTYRKHNGSGETFTVGYIGGVRYKKQCELLIEAAQALDMPLLMAGFENGEAQIEPLCRAYPKGTWIGGFDYPSQIADLYSRCDVIYSVYDADMANVRVALPNKIYEAVYCELPLIAAKNTHLAELVKEWGVGEAVDWRTAGELTQLLKKLRDDREYYRSMAQNCKKYRDEIDLNRYNEQLRKILSQWEA